MPQSTPPLGRAHHLALSLSLWALCACGVAAVDNGPADDRGNPDDLSCASLVPLGLWATDPSAVMMLFRIETCRGDTVIMDPGPGDSVFDYYTIEEDGSSLSSEAVPKVDISGNQRAYVTLLLDFSSSTLPVKDDILAAAGSFVDALLGASERVWVGIQIFDGRPNPVTIQLPTPDIEELRSAITDLADYSDPAADESSTNLNGAITAGVQELQRWQGMVMARNDLGVVTSGYVVAFTDGRDTAQRVSTATAEGVVLAARNATGTGDESGNVQTYAVALRGDDYTAEARSDLLTVLGGNERALYEGSIDELNGEFRELAQRIAEQADATHLLKYCSAARSGTREVELGLAPLRAEDSNTIVFRFHADGFAPGCADFIETICEDRECGGFNCGGCDDRSQSCRPDSGVCVSDCVVRGMCGGETLTTDLGYRLTCDAGELSGMIERCDGDCADTTSDPDHCGTCDNVCETLGGEGERCVNGVCECPGGGEICHGACRDAAYFETARNCGSCGNECTSTGEVCVDGRCECPRGQTQCDGGCREASYFETARNCGSCGNECTSTGEVCVDGRCECPRGQTQCDGGCREASYFETARDCGTCGNACTGSGVVCVGGTCGCPGAGALNACRGCAPLAAEPGEACGPCGLDTWACDGEEAVACDGATACPTLRAPTGVAASTTLPDVVRVTWNAVADATGYEVEVGGGTWTPVGNMLAWDDTAAPAGTIAAGTATASDGTYAAHVALALAGASASPGASRGYRVRAVRGADPGTESSTVNGNRAVGSLTYQWQRSSGDSDAGYSVLGGATSASYGDTTAPADGSGRWYRCTVSAAGALSVTTAGDRGNRQVGSLLAIGAACTLPSQCNSNNCSNFFCAPAGFVTLNPSPPTTFTMGSPSGELGRGSDETQHAVTLTHRFFMQSKEVTQGEWLSLSGTTNPSNFTSCGTTCPVEQVDWFSVVAYANELSVSEGLTPCYTLPACGDAVGEWGDGDTTCVTEAVTFSGLSCLGYRLPTESEWEYAYRAGTTTATYWNGSTSQPTGGDLQSPYACDPQPNLEPIAWYCQNAGSSTHPVGLKADNAWGLRDMAGNVWEWTWDWYGRYPGSVTDPLGAGSGSYRVYRGGGWDYYARSARAGYRYYDSPDYRNNYLGFRLARTGP